MMRRWSAVAFPQAAEVSMGELEMRELRIALDRVRSPVALEIVGDERPAPSTFRLANISRSGMFLEAGADVALKQGAQVRFSLRLDQEGKDVNGVARVRWVRQQDRGPRRPRGFGVQVVEFDEHDERRYLEFLENCLVNLRVTDLMDPDFVGVLPDATVADVVRKMQDRGSDCCVIGDAGGAPLGIFTKSDLGRICLSRTFQEESVGRHMTPGPTTLTSAHTIDDAYRMMRNGALSHVPVTEDDLSIGLLSMRALVRYWAEHVDLQAKRVIRNADRAMSVMAHDLRTPIGLIQTINLMLTSGEISPTEYMALEFPEVLENSCEMMMGLIDDILDLQRFKVGGVRLQWQSVDLEALTRKVLKAFGPAAAAKRLTLRLTVQAPVPRIKADPLQLERVLNNLVSNALKFSAEGGSIVVGLRSLPAQVALWVADNGPGISPADLQTLFQEYCELSNRPTRGEKSTGLGLVITKRLVEAHGGEIEVESHPGLGTTFTVKLPIGDLQSLS
jgi:signal transduction histidine kinase